MKRFSTYLFEAEFKRRNAASNDDEDYHEYHHLSRIGGRGVKTVFHRHFGTADDIFGHHYSASFAVNQKHDHDPSTDHKNNLRIMAHVHGVVHKFIREKKPHSLDFMATDKDPHKREQKQRVYDHIARDLAAKHGGTTKEYTWPNGSRATRVNFLHK